MGVFQMGREVEDPGEGWNIGVQAFRFAGLQGFNLGLPNQKETHLYNIPKTWFLLNAYI